jgi:hypothetical protein
MPSNTLCAVAACGGGGFELDGGLAVVGVEGVDGTDAGVEAGVNGVGSEADVPAPCPLVVHAASRSNPASTSTSRRIYSAQSNVLVTAFFQVEYLASRSVASIAGCHVRPAAQFARISSVDDQNPTANPAA